MVFNIVCMIIMLLPWGHDNDVHINGETEETWYIHKALEFVVSVDRWNDIWTTPASSFLCVWNMIQTDINICTILIYIVLYGFIWTISVMDFPFTIHKSPSFRCSTTASPTWENPMGKIPWGKSMVGIPKKIRGVLNGCCLCCAWKLKKGKKCHGCFNPSFFFHPHIFFHMLKAPKPRVLSQAWPLPSGKLT